MLPDRDTNGNGTLDERLYALQDANYNVTAVTDAAGAVVQRFGYDAYGRAEVMDGSWGSRSASAYDWEVRYAGYRWDSESGLYQVRWRYLHPGLGRWMSRDPLGYVDDLTLYGYVSSRPLRFLDPLGLAKVSYADMCGHVHDCKYDLPEGASDFRKRKLQMITPEVMLCLFAKESSFDTEARSPQGYYGLGQLGEAAAADVDAGYKLEKGTAWKGQLSNDPCTQVKNSIAYLHVVLSNPNDMPLADGHPQDGSLRDGLRRYGPLDARFRPQEYADPILDCAKCLEDSKREGDRCAPAEAADDCFKKMEDAVRAARAERERDK